MTDAERLEIVERVRAKMRAVRSVRANVASAAAREVSPVLRRRARVAIVGECGMGRDLPERAAAEEEIVRDRWQANRDKRAALDAADASGEVADSMAVRLDIVRRLRAGEITLEEGQAELIQIRRGATKAGKTTRARVWRQS